MTHRGAEKGAVVREMSLPQWKHNSEKDQIWHMKKSEDDSNCFSPVNGEKFLVRGQKYPVNKVKLPSKRAPYELVCCKCFKSENRIERPCSEIKSLRGFLEREKNREFFILNWLVPGHYTVVNVYVRTGTEVDEAFEKLWTKFKKGDEKFRNERFKFIPQLLSAPFSMRSLINGMLGGLRPVLIGKRLKCHHVTGENYVGVTVDTGSASIVSFVASTMIKQFAHLVANMACVIEGREESELPERIIAAHCYSKVDLKKIEIPYGNGEGNQNREA
mmetsp:Transcript_12545/g.30891  ORF Transcript_12545/g.30891 Transcript_12545/m.30891 type:complete len:274 (-) Transcript_12545:124-945(-)|eukprot:CAMPEP_0114518114 /NCGR_PEP_ID=MMETSP0109-20121206/18266_1 /TAXON_ID=29199 /ORGANISM="Chlorarachnion reptans, Strain CCCM449" /LENGTH=273 /DNA_ID=CAMNT_0001698703 /DNA_START=61 /DNA_END=882 /DNA_ORIENTATION=-